MLKKAEWMAQNGFHQEAIHATWINCRFRAYDCLQNGDPEVISEATLLTNKWLGQMGWEGQGTSTQKIDLIEATWQNIKTDLP